MHNIEPHHRWRDKYISSDDENTPFYGRIYDEFSYNHKIYNYYIHPQWDYFGSSTLYTKLLFTDYDTNFAIFEMMGEWNDCLNNDIMFFKRDVIDRLTDHNISKFILICENVLNFHGGDDDYYEEWTGDIVEEGGWVTFINTLNHVEEEMQDAQLQYHINFGKNIQFGNWRLMNPKQLLYVVENILESQNKQLRY